MKNLKNKKGISLIVLVITIIVMIILATAIILSLSNSGIIGKANKAKNDSDTATLKEYVNTLKLDWELMTAEEKEATGSSEFIDYANAKLASEGYNQKLNEKGVLLSEYVVNALENGIEIGDTVTGYNSYLTSKIGENAPSTSGNENTVDPQTEYQFGNESYTPIYGVFPKKVENRIDFTWEYIGVSDDGKLMITPVLEDDTENPIPKMEISGYKAYKYAPDELNTICQKLYSTSKGTARSMNIEDVNKLLNYTPAEPIGFREYISYGSTGYIPFEDYDIDDFELNSYDISKSNTSVSDKIKDVVFCDVDYWLSSSAFNSDGTYNYFCIRCVYSSQVVSRFILHYSMLTIKPTSKVVRPVVLLNTDVALTKTADNIWTIK